MSKAEAFLKRQQRMGNPVVDVTKKRNENERADDDVSSVRSSFQRQRARQNPPSLSNLITPRKNAAFSVGFAALLAIAIIGTMIADRDDETSSSNAQNTAMTFERAKECVFAVVVMDGDEKIDSTGSSFAVATHDLITNKHVVNNKRQGDEVLLLHPDRDRPIVAKIKAISPRYDLAWLAVDESLPALNVSCELCPQASQVHTLGYPGYSYEMNGGNLPEITYSRGVIKATSRVVANNECYETDAAINGGNSGGPLLNNSLQVIGVNTFSFDQAGVANGTFLAVKIETIRSTFPKLWNKINHD